MTPRQERLDAILRALGRAGLGLPADGAASSPPPAHRLGAISLHPHQVDAATRLAALLVTHGGALLADDVGLGKTYTALAVAAGHAHAEVIAPAALRPMWRAAIAQAGEALARVPVHSLQAFSRELPADGARRTPRRLVVIDEAHHLRNPATRRYAHVAAWCRGARVLLLSATPVHNRADDLGHLLALFLGGAAHALPAADRLRLIVRRAAHEVPTAAATPRVHAMPSRLVPDAPSVTRALARLPPPLPTRDGRAAGALVALGLVRAWCSSAAACLALLRRRRLRAEALAGILAEGRWPSREELRAWTVSGDAVQLGFTALLVPDPPRTGPASPRVEAEWADARRTLSHHLDALSELETLVRAADDVVDRARVGLLRRIRLRHPGASLLAFTQFAETVAGLGRRMRWDAGVATLTARGGRVAGGPLSRADLLARVAPHAHGRPAPPAHERITLLLTTDLLAEGVNLQDASVVVHLDQPWTPAALAQREGRIARLGSRHAEVFAYTLRPPGGGAALLAIAERLRGKARAAQVALAPERLAPAASVVVGAPSCPATPGAPANDARTLRLDATDRPSLTSLLAAWAARRGGPAAAHEEEGPERAHHEAAEARQPFVLRIGVGPHGTPPRAGWLAAVTHDGKTFLAGGWYAGVPATRPRTSLTREPRTLHALVLLAEHAAAADRAARGPVAHRAEASALRRLAVAAARAIGREHRRLAARAIAGALGTPAARARRVIRDLLARAPLAQRLALASRAAAAGRALHALRGAGDERALATLLARAGEPDAAGWLDAVIDLVPGERSAGPAPAVPHASPPTTRPVPPAPFPRTLLLLVP